MKVKPFSGALSMKNLHGTIAKNGIYVPAGEETEETRAFALPGSVSAPETSFSLGIQCGCVAEP
jgi:hypothetical protein